MLSHFLLPPAVLAPHHKFSGQGLTYVMALGRRLWSTSMRMESVRSRGGAGERGVSLVPGPCEAIATLRHSGPCQLACSASGRSLSVVWPERRAYVVYTLAPTGIWEGLDSGRGTSVVWSSTTSMYAVLSVPPAPLAAPRSKKGGLFGPGKKEREAAEAAADEAARAEAAGASVEVHAVDEAHALHSVVAHEVRLGGDARPAALHGGAMLGVTLTKTSATGEWVGAA